MYENKVFFKMFYRTASALFNYLTFKQLVDREKLEPLLIRKTIPLNNCIDGLMVRMLATRAVDPDFDI
jgi:hypothetical protein